MFQKMKNIDTAFRYIRSFSLLLVLACLGISVYAIYSAKQVITTGNQKVYVLAGDKALEAYASDRKDNIPVEARDHVKTFHQYFFSLDPDDKVIAQNINKALYLADRSAKEQYDNLKENNFYAGIISGNISQEIQIDSVQVNTATAPYYFRCKAVLRILRPSSIISRSLVTEGYLRSVARSDNNTHGFLIERWRTLENTDIKTEAR